MLSPPSASSTTLGIYGIPVVVLYCRAHGYCAVEHDIACCAKCCTASATLTKVIRLSMLPEYLAVYPKFNVNLLKPAAAPPQAGPRPISTSMTSHLGQTGPTSSPISEAEYEIECILRERLFQGKR